VNKLLSSAIGI